MCNYACPKEGCDRKLHTIGGMRSHVANGHNDRSIYSEDRLCQVCGDSFKSHVSHTTPTCSGECQRKRQQKIAQEVGSGEAASLQNPYAKYSTEWSEKTSAVIREEGGRCQACGVENETHKRVHDRELHVHHIHPKNKFKDEYGRIDFERAESRENLVPFCHKCHSKWEGIPVRPSVVVT